MFKLPLIALSLVCSFEVLAKVSLMEKQNRVDRLMELRKFAPHLNFEAYERELNYEKQGLSLSRRAKLETNALSSKIQNQILKAYSAAFEEYGNHAEAYDEVKKAIERDLGQAAPELKDELGRFSLDTLDSIQKGGASSEAELKNVEAAMLKSAKERSEFLNAEKPVGDDPLLPSASDGKDAERIVFNNENELLESLASDRTGTRFTSTSMITVKAGKTSKKEDRVDIQLKLSFLGTSIEAGPVISFQKEFSSSLTIIAEGLNPVIKPDGNFDLYIRDKADKIVVKGGKEQKRFRAFTCDLVLSFNTDNFVGATFSTSFGQGISRSYNTVYSSDVALSSRRIAVPETIGNKTVTLSYLSSLCQDRFRWAYYSNTLKVNDSLNTMMKNVIANLNFSHAKTKCAVDSDCFNWYNREILSLSRYNNYPRCVEDRREKFRYCALYGLKGQNCAVIKDGKRISDGMFEFPCDKGLKCVQVSEGGWFKNWEIKEWPKGQCQPINK